MKTQEDYKILEAMSTYGGSFVMSLAQAARLADSENYAKLKAAFPEIWDSYAGFVRTNNTQMHLVSEDLSRRLAKQFETYVQEAIK